MNILTDLPQLPEHNGFKRFSNNCTLALKQVILEALHNNGYKDITIIHDDNVNRIATITTTLTYEGIPPKIAFTIALKSYTENLPINNTPITVLGLTHDK